MTGPAYRLLAAAEVARILHVSPETVLKYVAEGHLPSIRVGEKGRHRFRPEDVARLIQEGSGPVRRDAAQGRPPSTVVDRVLEAQEQAR